MTKKRKFMIVAAFAGAIVAALLVGFSARLQMPQQMSGPPGSPGATTTIDGRYLPPQPPRFRGEINPNAVDSRPYWPALVVPPVGAPNILLIMTDDVGFSAPSTFGGVIPTPALDRIAEMGLRYTRFHTTALCSPTRAALLTGRNHHSVATGVVVDQATGYPGYNSVIPRDAVAIGEILRQNGFDTSWYGKDHNVPQWVASQAGPFTDWPTGPIKGFDHYYGFVGDDTNQWQPNNLFRNTTPIEPYLGHPGWNLITAMADEAIGRIKMLNEVQPDRPFMIYYAPGGTHAPHHPTREWVDRISAMHLFDEGWNKQREHILANQKILGVIPQDAKLTAWPKDLPRWETLSPEAKQLYTHQANIYAAYLAYTDHEIGRVIQAVQDAGKLDNTLIIYISGDNGASPEGTLHGLYSEYAVLNGIHPTVQENMKFYNVWGTDPDLPALRSALGLGLGDALPVDEGSGLTLRRHAQRHGHGLARAHQGPGRHPAPVPSRDRHRADDSGGSPHSGAGLGQRDHTKTHRGREHGLHVGQRRCPRAKGDPVLRDVRLARDLPQRMDRLRAPDYCALVAQPSATALGRHDRLQMGTVQPEGGHG